MYCLKSAAYQFNHPMFPLLWICDQQDHLIASIDTAFDYFCIQPCVIMCGMNEAITISVKPLICCQDLILKMHFNVY